MDDMTVTTRIRPLGATIVAIFLVIQAILELFGVVAALTAFGSGLAGTLAIANLLLTILSIVMAYGLWMLKPWAYWATVGFAALNILVRVFSLTLPNANIASIIIRMVVPALILVYFLVDQQVRRAYRA